jgi:hypothetical protein
LIERRTARILQLEYRAVQVASHRDRSGRPRRVKRLSERAFVLQPFQTFWLGILRDWREHENLRRITLTPPAIKDELFILPQHL